MKIKFENFWQGFIPTSNGFINKVISTFNAEIVDTNPDMIFYSVYGWRGKNQKPQCWNSDIPRVCWSGESLSDEKINQVLDRGDYLIYSKRVDHPRYLRLTSSEAYNWYDVDVSTLFSEPAPNKTRFCSFIYHNTSPKHREQFCKQLMQYKKVDCLGRSLNNAKSSILTGRFAKPGVAGMGRSNIDVLKPYKFNLAIENELLRGYMTEKIWWAFLAKTINLYWGDPTVYESFNKGSFLCRDDFVSEKQFIDAIIELDNDDEAYNEMLNRYPIKDQNMVNKNHASDFLKSIKI